MKRAKPDLHSCQDRYLKDKEYAQAVASQLSKIGVNVQVKFLRMGKLPPAPQKRKTSQRQIGNVRANFI